MATCTKGNIGTLAETRRSSTFFSAGESIQLILASDEIIKSPPNKKSAVINSGNHVLHFGGKYDSYILIPVIPPKEN